VYYSDSMTEERLHRIRKVLLVLGYISLAFELLMSAAMVLFNENPLVFPKGFFTPFTFIVLVSFFALPPISPIFSIISIIGLHKRKKWAYYLILIPLIPQAYFLGLITLPMLFGSF
jgi:hypothetical protein